MTPSTKYAYDRLWKLNDHADLQEYGPDLLIQDVQTVVAALASAERELVAYKNAAPEMGTALDALGAFTRDLLKLVTPEQIKAARLTTRMLKLNDQCFNVLAKARAAGWIVAVGATHEEPAP